jgi:hypothetical protein
MFIQTFTKVQLLKEPKDDFETPSFLTKKLQKEQKMIGFFKTTPFFFIKLSHIPILEEDNKMRIWHVLIKRMMINELPYFVPK